MQENLKQLLLIDLSARLPYGVICNTPKGNGHLNSINQTIFDIELGININAVHRDIFKLEECKPYLRSMDSMTEDEKIEWDAEYAYNSKSYEYEEYLSKMIDWLNAHHFDYRGLIEKGLALEAPKGKEE